MLAQAFLLSPDLRSKLLNDQQGQCDLGSHFCGLFQREVVHGKDPRAELDFLKDADGVWATEERERLRRWVTQVALETMAGWYRTGQFEKCVSLAERQQPLDLLDKALHEFLIQATLETRGRAAAYPLYLNSAETFRRGVDEVPPRLQVLSEDIRKRPFNQVICVEQWPGLGQGEGSARHESTRPWNA